MKSRGDITSLFSNFLSLLAFVLLPTASYSNLTLSTQSEKAKVNLTWTSAPGSGPYVYKLEKMGINGTAVYQHTIGTFIGPGTFTDTLVSNSDSYAYRIIVAGQTPPFEWHNTSWTPGRTSLAAPAYAYIENLGNNNLQVRWTPVTWADEYYIYTGVDFPTSLDSIVPAGTLHLNLGHVIPSTRANRVYAVYAKNQAGFSPISPWATLDGTTISPSDPSIKPPYDSSQPLYPAAPINRFNPRAGGTKPPPETGPGPLNSGDPINLASGHEEYNPAPDLTAYNPSGIPTIFHRVYYGAAARELP